MRCSTREQAEHPGRPERPPKVSRTDQVFGERYREQRTPLWQTIEQAVPEGTARDTTAALAHPGLL